MWEEYENRFAAIKAECPSVVVRPLKHEKAKAGTTWRDRWGCLWKYNIDYLEGQVVKHPLKNWQDFAQFSAPEVETEQNWEEVKADTFQAKKKGEAAFGWVEHGFFYLKLTYLQGFENLMLDIAEGNAALDELIGLLTNYWMEVTRRWIDLDVDCISFGDDLGLQNSLPVSPSAWRTYIKPAYKKIFSLCRNNNVEVYLHTDGYILDIIPDLIQCGVTILNPQDLVNGLENLKKLTKGKIAIDLDIDRQKIIVFGTPDEIDSHIRTCITTLGSPTGGLSLVYGAYPGTPVQNIEAVIRAMEKYRTLWVKDKPKI